jgi:DNA invertase Pin-like site-specific DNA recombinase
MENRTHAVINGLVAEGERCGNAKLNIESIAEIRKLYANGVSQKKIANNYGIIQQTVSVIVRYKSWKKCA